MRKSFGRTPRHCEHDVHRNAQCLGAVDMCKRRRIRDDGVCDERLSGERVRIEATFPAAIDHLFDHLALLADIAALHGFHCRDEAWVSDHVLRDSQSEVESTTGNECLLTDIKSAGSPPMG